MGRKRGNSSAPPKASPALKRRRAQSDAGCEPAAEPIEPEVNEVGEHEDANSDTEPIAGRKEETVVDKDGSFFHATPTQATGEAESCIKFVHVLPSETIGSDTKSTQRVTRSSQKAPQAVSDLSVSNTPKASQKPKQESTTKPKPQSNPKKKTPSKPKAEPKPKGQPCSKSGVTSVQQDTPKQQPKLTLKLSTSSLVSSARIEPECFVDEYKDAEDYKEDDGDDGVIDPSDIDIDAAHVMFAIEQDGAHEIVRLPVTINYDLFHFNVSETIQSIPNNMKLTYKCPGVKKSELGVHLSSADHFEHMREKIISDLKKIVAKVKAVGKGGGKQAVDQ